MKYESNEEYLSDLIALGRVAMAVLHIEEGKEEEEKTAKLRKFYVELERKSSKSVEEGVFLPLEYLFTLFELDPFERATVRLAMLPQLSRSFEDHFALIHNDRTMRLLSPELALSFYCKLAGKRVAGDISYFLKKTPLTSFFLEKQQGNGGGLSMQFALGERVSSFVLAQELSDPRLFGITQLWNPEEYAESELEQEASIDKLTKDRLSPMERYAESGGDIVFFLNGPEILGKTKLIEAFCTRHEIPVLFVDMSKAFKAERNVGNLLLAECIIQGCCLALYGLDDMIDREENVQELSVFLEQAFLEMPYIFVMAQGEWNIPRRNDEFEFVTILFDFPDEAQRLVLWEDTTREAVYPLSGSIRLFSFANKFVFTAEQIKNAVLEAESLAKWKNAGVIDEECLYEGCRGQLPGYSKNSKVIKVTPIYKFDDLILPEHSKALLKSACQQVEYGHMVYKQWGFGSKLPYGRGLSMVFAGPPGTGKTMSAQVVASHLHLELFKVDLAGVVSKYIGETEKNLQQIFQDARKSQAILFFDEADVLFSKRTEVKDSNDKYSNMEAAFMLQKIEEYDGVSILATNYMQNFDEAFKRRIKFIIDFPFPNAYYRALLWQKVFPEETPLNEDVELEYLADNFELSGSNIKNIAVNAAFLAAAAEKKVGMHEILTALRNEMAKSGKFVSKEEMGQYGRLF